MQTNVRITLVFLILMFYVQNDFKTGIVYGNRVCHQQLCTKVGDDCIAGISSQANDQLTCSKRCQNSETCEMVAYHPNTGVCSLYTCRHCSLSAEGQAVYFCTTDCGYPPTPANGAVILTNTGVTTLGATGTQTCNNGYNLSGTADITCEMDGSWSNQPVTCSLIAGIATFGASATQSCNTGYDLIGTAAIPCGADGSWRSASPVTCTLKYCGDPPTPSNGKLTTAGVTTYGASATQSCNSGYDLSGSAAIFCGADGSWNASPVTCTLKDCGDPPNPSNGKVTTTGVTTFGASATQSCNSGYDLSGIAAISCGAGGSWSASPVTCTLKDCGDPPTPTSGMVITAGVTTYGASATQSCNSGYILSGSALISCGVNGSWNASAVICTLKDCKAPEQPSNGILKLTVDGVTTYGATATVSCNTGYELFGDRSVRCRADGIWSALPSCDFKEYIAALAAIGGVTCVGLAAAAGYWFIIRKRMKSFRTVRSVKSDELDGNDHA